MELGLKVYTTENAYGFPRCDMNVWISESDQAVLYAGLEIPPGPQYVKITCNAILSKFVMYAKLAILNSRIEQPNGYVWISKELLHKSWLVEKDTRVEVSLVDYDELILAESIIVNLKPEEVANWSDEEVQAAEGFFITQNRISYDSQMVFVKPATKKTVLGEVDSIFPRKNERNIAYRVDSTTKITFNGIPIERQKVIDFSQIGGLDSVISKLREIIQIPLTYPELLNRFGIKTPKGMLMYGPPGNGKTMIARAVAYSMGSSFISIEGPELMSKYVGEGERKLREKFEEAESKGNCVIFIDEIDSVASIRSDSSAEFQVSIVATLLNLMDGMKSSNKVFVIGATNRLNAIDPALRRPGRFDLEFEVPLPNLAARQDILSKYVRLEHNNLFAPSVNEKLLFMIGELTNGYSGADISLLYREAVMGAIRKSLLYDKTTGKIELSKEIDDIKLDDVDFYSAMKNIVPTSLRGMDMERSDVCWGDLLALDNAKLKLEQLNRQLSAFIEDDSLWQRPSFANILLTGQKGTGKRTLLSAFANQFGYEQLVIDFISLSSMSIMDSFNEIDQVFMKCRQIAPVLLILKNLDKVPDKELFANKILSEIGKLNKHLKALVALVADSKEKLPEIILGYKAFSDEINIDLDTDEIIKCVSNKFNSPLISDGGLDGKTIGQLISEIKEAELRRKYSV